MQDIANIYEESLAPSAELVADMATLEGEKESLTWAMNSYLRGRVAEKYRNSRIVAFSTGNVYPLSSVDRGGVAEESPTGPIGEYARFCLGRERIFQYFASKYNTAVFIYRLNYAKDVSYGVLLEIKNY